MCILHILFINNPNSPNPLFYNKLMIKPDYPYQFVIGAKKSTVLQIQSKYRQIKINFKSTASLQVCITQNINNRPFPPNCYTAKGQYTEMNQVLILREGLTANIGILNNNVYNVSFKFYATQLYKTQCLVQAMNQIIIRDIGPSIIPINNQNSTQSSIDNIVNEQLCRIAEIELIIKFMDDEFQFNQGDITVNINEYQQFIVKSPTHTFTKDSILKACTSKGNKKSDSQFCSLRIKFSLPNKQKVSILVQYTDQPIKLVEGISHFSNSAFKNNQPKLFFYQINNIKQDIFIVLQSKIRNYILYCSLVKKSEYVSMKRQNRSLQIYPSKLKSDFQTPNKQHYLQQIMKVLPTHIQRKCFNDTKDKSNEESCILLLSLYANDDKQIKDYQYKFNIEITQKLKQIRNNVPISGFLQKNQLAFYYFNNQVQKGTFILNISNQNKYCLDVYFKKGLELSQDPIYLQIIQAENTLVYDNMQFGVYSVIVQANQNCAFTMTASLAKSKVSKIRKGDFYDLNLDIGKSNYILYQNLINETFKIICMRLIGQVLISVMPVQKINIKQVLNSDLTKINDWKWSHKNTVQIQNIVSSLSKFDYCVDCYYLIKIEAYSPTKSTVVVNGAGDQIISQKQYYIQDVLSERGTLYLKVFIVYGTHFQVHVQFGRLRIVVQQILTGRQSFNEVFQPTKDPVVKQFISSRKKEDIAKDYSQQQNYRLIKIIGQEKSLFSFVSLQDLDAHTKLQTKLRNGIPKQVFISYQKQKCVVGSINSKTDEFIFSYLTFDKWDVANLQIVLTIQQKQVQYIKQTYDEQMLLKVADSAKQLSGNFKLCMKIVNSTKVISVNLIQTSILIYLPENQYHLVKQQANITFSTHGKTIIELNECQGRATAQVFQQFHDLKSTFSSIKQRRRDNNLVQFYTLGVVYMRVQAKKSRIKWFYSDRGVNSGYDDYKPGSLRYLHINNQIQLTADPIQVVGSSLGSRLVYVNYRFFVSKQESSLYSAMNCGEGEYSQKNKRVDLSNNTNNTLIDQKIIVNFDIQKQLQNYWKYSNFVIGLKAEAVVVVNQTKQNPVYQGYRFIYPYQRIIIQYLRDNIEQQQAEEQTEFSYQNVLFLLIFVIIIVITYCLYQTRKIKKRGEHVLQAQNYGSTQMKYIYTQEQSG